MTAIGYAMSYYWSVTSFSLNR